MDQAARGGLPWWFYALFLGLGVVFIAIGVLTASGARRFLATAAAAEGRIVDYTADRDLSDDDDQVMYTPVIEFTTSDERVLRFTAGTSSSSRPAVGRQVTVLYDPAQPERARLKSWAALWMLPVIFGGMGAVLAVLGVTLGIVLRPRRARAGT